MTDPHEAPELTLSPGEWIGFTLLILGHVALAAYRGLLAPFR